MNAETDLLPEMNASEMATPAVPMDLNSQQRCGVQSLAI